MLVHSVQADDGSTNDLATTAKSFLSSYCSDCHVAGSAEGGFSVESLTSDLSDRAVFARWEQVYDRVMAGEMPPADADQPTSEDKQIFDRGVSSVLNDVHASTKATVLRRLNRREYQNTVNDMFGTHLDLERMLPEDSRSHEFDNVGEALGLSMVHLQRYMDAAKLALHTTIESRTEAPTPKTITAWYKDTREAETHVGKAWKLLDDGFMVRFAGGGYPTGMMRGTGVRQSGLYRIRVTGYSHQSQRPITFSVGATSFARGSEKPIFGFFEVPPDQPTTIELEAWIEDKYMIAIEPYGIFDPGRYKRKSVAQYEGPGLAIGEVSLEGPLVEQFPSRGHNLIFDGINRVEIEPRNPRDRTKPWYVPRFEIHSDDPNRIAEKAFSRVARIAFRRPVEPRDVKPFVELFANSVANGASTEDAMRDGLTAILCSPRFLFFNEPSGRLDDHAIAARLSYLLHRTSPDDELASLADQGRLTNPQELRRQTERLLADERFNRFLVDFSDSWLDLREIDFTQPDGRLFPEFDSFLRHSMPIETREFLREMIVSNLPIEHLVKSDFAMINSRLAEHYGLPPVDGPIVRKVTLPPESVRGGLLSQASILKVTSNGTNTSPVTRGAWVMERIQGVTPPPPPPGVPGVEPDIRGATTLRQILEQHRSNDNCRACHLKIDPPGFAMECFNPIGGFRERYRSLGNGERIRKQVRGRNVSYKLGLPVDASGNFADGSSFKDFVEFRDNLSLQKRMIAKTFLKKILVFATGRELGFSDRPELNQIVDSLSATEFRAADIIHAAIASEIFLNK